MAALPHAPHLSRPGFMVGIFRDLEHADVYLETFPVTSLADDVRPDEGFTVGDRESEGSSRSF
jgi:hypothetical protein